MFDVHQFLFRLNWPNQVRSGLLSIRSRSLYEIYDAPGQFFTAVFLKEMSAAFDGCVRLSFGARHLFLEYTFAPAGDGVAVAECRQKRFLVI
jgi:hypothetical protein